MPALFVCVSYFCYIRVGSYSLEGCFLAVSCVVCSLLLMTKETGDCTRNPLYILVAT